MAYFKCSLNSSEKAVFKTGGSSLLYQAWPPWLRDRCTLRHKGQAATLIPKLQPQSNLNSPSCIPGPEVSIFETEVIFNIFHSVNIFTFISLLLPPAPMPLVGLFLRPNKNKTRPRLRPADRDVLDGFCYVPAKTVSKIYRKHLAESIGRSGGHQEVQGRYTLGVWNWLSRPGYRKWPWDSRPWEGKHTAVGGLADHSGVFHWEFLRLAYLFPPACA